MADVSELPGPSPLLRLALAALLLLGCTEALYRAVTAALRVWLVDVCRAELTHSDTAAEQPRVGFHLRPGPREVRPPRLPRLAPSKDAAAPPGPSDRRLLRWAPPLSTRRLPLTEREHLDQGSSPSRAPPGQGRHPEGKFETA